LKRFNLATRLKKSTVDAVASLIQTSVTAKNKHKKVMAIFLDLSKAIDCVQHEILLSILEKYGIRGKMYNIIKSYLSNRYQYVEISQIINNVQVKARSTLRQAEENVPQGSVLGPLLFIIYIYGINHVVKNLGGHPIVYVDDTNIIIEADSCEELQETATAVLLGIKEYFNSLRLALNLSKSVYMIFNYKQEFILKIANVTLERVQETNFLGLKISENLKWKSHMLSLQKKLNKKPLHASPNFSISKP